MVTKEVFDKLRELQDILARKNQLEAEIAEAPALLIQQEELLARAKAKYIKKNTEYEALRQTIGALKADLFSVEQRLEHAEKSMDGITTQREYDALDKEIQDAKKKEAELRKDILKNENIYKRLDEEIKEEEAAILMDEKDLNERKAVIENEIAEKRNELVILAEGEKKLSPDLDSDTLFKFNRIIKNKQGIGIVPVQGNVCMGCHMFLSAQFAIEVHEGKDIMYCPYCSRILYYQPSETDSDTNVFFDSFDDSEEEENSADTIED